MNNKKSENQIKDKLSKISNNRFDTVVKAVTPHGTGIANTVCFTCGQLIMPAHTSGNHVVTLHLLNNQPCCEYCWEDEAEVSPEVTCAIITPSLIASNPRAVASVMREIAQIGFHVLHDSKITLTDEMAQVLLHKEGGEPFPEDFVEEITSGVSRVLALEAVGAVELWNDLIGPRDPEEARQTAPDSLRARLGSDQNHNGFYGSPTGETAARDLQLFFPQAGFKLVSVDVEDIDLQPSNKTAQTQNLEGTVTHVTENSVTVSWVPPVLSVLSCRKVIDPLSDTPKLSMGNSVKSSEGIAQFTGLESGQLYQIEVDAVIKSENLGVSKWEVVVMPLPPVRSLFACALTHTKATLCWASSSHHTPGPVTIMKNLVPPNTNIPRLRDFSVVPSDDLDMLCSLCYSTSNLENSRNYVIRVFNGPEQMHETEGRMTNITLPKTQITDITACSDEEGSVTILWKVPDIRDKHFKLESQPAPRDPTNMWNVIAEQMVGDSVTLEDLTLGQLYVFRITCDGDDEGAIVYGVGLQKVQQVQIKENKGSGVVLEWTKALGASRYAVEIRRDGEEEWSLLVDDMETTEMEVQGLAGSSKAEFRITPGTPMALAGASLSATCHVTVSASQQPSEVSFGRSFTTRRAIHGMFMSPTTWINEPQSYDHINTRIDCWMSPAILRKRREILAAKADARTPRGVRKLPLLPIQDAQPFLAARNTREHSVRTSQDTLHTHMYTDDTLGDKDDDEISRAIFTSLEEISFVREHMRARCSQLNENSAQTKRTNAP